MEQLKDIKKALKKEYQEKQHLLDYGYLVGLEFAIDLVSKALTSAKEEKRMKELMKHR